MTSAPPVWEPSLPTTLTQFILNLERTDSAYKGFSNLIGALATSCKIISHAVSVAPVQGLTGSASGAANTSGDIVKKLDLLSNATLIQFLKNCGEVAAVNSEEEENLVLPPPDLNGTFVVSFDPLDGSSNIDAGVNVGTIFGIHRRLSPAASVANLGDALQPACALVASGYCMYGASSILMLAVNGAVNGFTLDMSIGEFVITHPNVKVPQRGAYYSANEGRSESWDDATKAYVNGAKSGAFSGKPSTLRYIGTMVGDVHRTLLYGGIFFYPKDKKDGKGKLRHLYECGPMAHTMSLAGGAASTGLDDVLTLQPSSIHGRIPIWIGSKLDVEDAIRMYKEHS